MIKSCETCIYSYYMYEYNPDGELIPESVYYLCDLDDNEYSDAQQPINCAMYMLNTFFEEYIEED